jgi:superfamily II DNA/RNA helicase
MRRGTLQMNGVRIVVLDEADEMLDMGFQEDIEAVLKASPADRQTVLFSATMPPRIEAITRRHQRDPVRIRIAKPAAKAGEAPRCGSKRTCCRARRRWKRSAASSTSSRPPRRSSSAERASRWTSSPRR